MSPRSFQLPARQRAARVIACLLVVAPSLLAAAVPENTVAQALRRLAADAWIARDITLAELGLTGPIVLGAAETRRELYLPVPPNVAIADATLRLDASYMRADGGRTSWVISLDGYPVSARPFALDKGDAGISLGVDGTARPSGFVRLGLNWSTAIGGEPLCADSRAMGNVLRIEPGSRLSYRYDGRTVRDVATAWAALPPAPVILVSGTGLDTPAYATAWRLGMAVERAGKHARFQALPAVGDVVDLGTLALPAGLSGVPAFAALAAGGSYKLKSAAEVGALLSLGQGGPWRADIVVFDKPMTGSLGAAYAALRKELEAAGTDAVGAFDEWRARALDPSAHAPQAQQVSLGLAFGRPALLIGESAGSEAAALFATPWSRLATGPSIVVHAASATAGDAATVPLQNLGGLPGSFDVLAHADWNASFDIGAVAAGGRVPASLVFDLAAAPSAGRTPPVVSVYFNDTLVAARQMVANGKPERLTAAIPRYALAARNVVRLAFVRQLADDRCRETPEPYPVSVLPSSHLVLDKAAPAGDFAGMAARYADGAQVLVPASYLAAAPLTLPRVVHLAALAGVSPAKAKLAVLGEGGAPEAGAFLAFDVGVKGARPKARVENGQLVVEGTGGKPVLELAGTDGVAMIEVISGAADPGIAYRGVGGPAPAAEVLVLPAHADLALIGRNGLLRQLDSADPDGQRLVAEGPRPPLLAPGDWWMVPILAIAFMVALLVVASRRRRRKTIERERSGRSKHSTQY